MDFECHIEVKSGNPEKWQRIASFENGDDRDFCLDAFAESFSDCEFRAVGNDD